MIRLAVLAGSAILVANVGVWLLLSDTANDVAPAPSPTHVEPTSPSPTPSPTDELTPAPPAAGPQIIERERITERDDDSDDDPPDVRVIVPRPAPTTARPTPRPTPSPTRTQAPILPDIEFPGIPAVPVEIPDLPLLN